MFFITNQLTQHRVSNVFYSLTAAVWVISAVGQKIKVDEK